MAKDVLLRRRPAVTDMIGMQSTAVGVARLVVVTATNGGAALAPSSRVVSAAIPVSDSASGVEMLRNQVLGSSNTDPLSTSFFKASFLVFKRPIFVLRQRTPLFRQDLPAMSSFSSDELLFSIRVLSQQSACFASHHKRLDSFSLSIHRPAFSHKVLS